MLAQNYILLYKVLYYCFGTIVSIEVLSVFVFFSALYQQSNYKHSSYLSKYNQQLWYNAVLSPYINKAVRLSNIVQHYSATTCIANVDSTIVSAETLA
jgi:hypothetical protein